MEYLGDVLKRAQLVRRTDGVAELESRPPACPHCHGAGYLRYDVHLDDPRFGELVVCECTRRDLEMRRLQRLIEHSNLGALRRATFDTFIRKVKQGTPPPRSPDAAFGVVRRYAEDPEGWLVLYGPFGTGKTHLAAAIANYRLALGEPAVFIVVPDLLDHLRATFSPNSDVTYDDLFETVRNTPLLILDDLGTQTSTPWAQEKLYQILNFRYNRELATVVTTNLEPDEIEPRLRSRLCDLQLSKLVEVRDKDKRLGQDHATVSSQARRPVRKPT
jgi:DNA replication protein DnaC